MTSPGSPGLGQAAARGAGITLGTQGVRFVLQFGSLSVLARLLSPTDFGLVAMVTAIVGVAEIIRDFGLSSAAIQAKQLNDDERSNLFWVNVAIGGACCLIAIAAIPLIIDFYGTPKVGPIVLSLAWLFIVSGINTQFRAELSRSLRFKALAVTDIVAQSSAIAVAIVAASMGAGYWAIVAQQATLTVLTCLSNMMFCHWRPGWFRRSVSIARFFRFGGGVLGTQVIGYATNNLDNVAIGAVNGAGPLGLYSRAYQLLMVPLNQINAPMTRVVLPVLARVQDDEKRYERYVLKAQMVGCYFLATLFAIAAGASVPIVAVLFGKDWSGVAPIFAALAIGGIFRGIAQVSYWVYLSRGETSAQLKMYLITRPAMIAMILAGLPWGPLGVAIGHSIAFFLYWIVSLWHSARSVKMRSRPLFTQATRSVLLVSGPAGLLSWLGASISGNTAIQLSLALGFSFTYMVLIALVSPKERADAMLILDIAYGAVGRRRSGRGAAGKATAQPERVVESAIESASMPSMTPLESEKLAEAIADLEDQTAP
jgi:O-antigen/teichoic acid export membrane protein